MDSLMQNSEIDSQKIVRVEPLIRTLPKDN
jgi:hypothetical protein